MDIRRRWLRNKFTNSLSLEIPMVRRKNNPGTCGDTALEIGLDDLRQFFPNLNVLHFPWASLAKEPRARVRESVQVNVLFGSMLHMVDP